MSDLKETEDGLMRWRMNATNNSRSSKVISAMYSSSLHGEDELLTHRDSASREQKAEPGFMPRLGGPQLIA